ncbi:protease complex subunit PrcB family protein [Methylococcus mesophilus]|uniref:protease complex subunit PrcB family protein n=1 Tax=Methylococcus mesophilus TaxID=2993564 RepID=UPI00224B6E3B|nr:protease complex subunit PrcB family protein [Methylococcus mesophilus]UZR30236.1 protease complex subunit PrcB family protein [Methylococcus mesophilus]
MTYPLTRRGLAFAAVMTASSGAIAGPIPFTVLVQGTQSGIEDERTAVILDEAAFRSLWASHGAGSIPAPSLPQLDFSGEMVIAAFAGAKNSGGYRLGIAGIEEKDRRIQVSLVLSRPGAGCMTAQVLTQPHVWAKIRRSSLPVEFRTSTVDMSCDEGE